MVYRCFRNFIEVLEQVGELKLARTFGIAAAALLFTSCGTPGTRISQRPEVYQRLSPRDQALVSQGQIRLGMTMDAVWLAWGNPEQKDPGAGRCRATETGVYLRKRSRAPGVVVQRRRGSICVTKPLLATAGRTITDHSTGHTSRQSSPTRPKGSLSPTAELFTSAICRRRRHRLVKQFRSHSVSKQMSLAARFRNGLPLIPQFPRRP